MKVAISENDARFSLDSIWSAYCRAVAAGVGNGARPLANLHGAPLGRYYRIANEVPESGEGVGASATSTYAYDDNGNLTSVITGATSTTYAYDYSNRLISERTTGASASTTYAYDASGNRILQTTGSTTTAYPNKYYSIITTTSGTSTIATSTEYVYIPGQNNGNNLLIASVDQLIINGTATGTPVIRYDHTDNLGSTNITSDSAGNLGQWLDYSPYGSVIASMNTGTTTASRQYIGQYYDAGSGLSYLNSRYYNGSRGQFTSQDPVFLGSPNQQNLEDPQSLNAYSYSEDNPIVKEDQNGKFPTLGPWTLGFAVAGAFYGVSTQMYQDVETGQTTSVPGYVEAGLTGAAEFAIGGASIENPLAIGVPVIRAYGYYQTGQDVYNLVNELYSPTSYSTPESLQTASNVYVELGQQAVESTLIPAPYRNIYESLTSIYNSLATISAEEDELSSTNQNTPKVSNTEANSGGSSNTSSSGSSGSSGSSQGQQGYNALPGEFNPFIPH